MLPEMVAIRQRLSGPAVTDIPAAMQGALARLNLAQRIRPGMRVGIPVGSRGIKNISSLLKEAVQHVRGLGAEPVLVTAMGSHGGGTAEGQLSVAASLGVTEESVGAPVHGTVESVEIGQTADGTPVYFDKLLLSCDAVLVINRVKPHTSFRGKLESGLTKMLVVGCGKAAGAGLFHNLGLSVVGRRLMEFGAVSLSRVPVVGGIAVLENQLEETADLVPVRPDGWMETEMGLLERAWGLMPGLPVKQLDVLVIDEIGKNYSGTGMDTNVVGRVGVSDGGVGPQIKKIVLLDLSEESHGNANGMGLSDLVHRRLVNKVDFKATYLNAITVTTLDRAKIPMTMESDREVIEVALRTCGPTPHPRIARIHNTLDLQNLWVSTAVMSELEGRSDIEVLGAPVPWTFDAAGNLF